MRLAVFACVILSGIVSHADPPAGSIMLDGIAALTAGLPSDESAAIPILKSDLELEARFLLVRRHGPSWKNQPIDESIRVAARRSAAFIKLLARQARQMGEAVDPTTRNALVDGLTTQAGGQDQMADLLRQSGADRDDLKAWAVDAALAIIKLTYLEERAEPPSDLETSARFAAGGHPFMGRELADVRSEFRRWLMDKQVERMLEEELASTLRHRWIRIIH
jgi:hypothetical protein